MASWPPRLPVTPEIRLPTLWQFALKCRTGVVQSDRREYKRVLDELDGSGAASAVGIAQVTGLTLAQVERLLAWALEDGFALAAPGGYVAPVD